jgi:uncharacterized protein (TIGR02996 family)
MAAARNADLEAAIAADPEDEGPYLVYADWLQSRGDPRGELIVVQHALETARGQAWARLRIRERELLAKYRDALLGPAALHHDARHFDWRRGFVDRMSAGFVLDEGEQLVAHPSLALVRAVSNVELRRLREVSLPLLEELAVSHESSRAVLAHTRLRHLALTRGTWWGSETAPPPDAPLETSRLETLAFDTFDDLGHGLAEHRFPRLRLVQMSHVSDDASAAVAQLLRGNPGARLALSLSQLHQHPPNAVLQDPDVRRQVRGLKLGDPSVALLRDLRTQLRRLESLELYAIRAWSPELVRELPVAPRLQRLVLESQIADPDAVAALATSPYAATLRSLAMPLRDRGAVAALSHGVFGAVKKLDINWLGDALSASDAAILADAFPAVEMIAIDDFRLRELADSPLAPRLRRLRLRGIRGAVRMAPWFLREIEKFRSLETLHLGGQPPTMPAVFETLGALELQIELEPNVRHFTEPAD